MEDLEATVLVIIYNTPNKKATIGEIFSSILDLNAGIFTLMQVNEAVHSLYNTYFIVGFNSVDKVPEYSLTPEGKDIVINLFKSKIGKKFIQ